MKFIGPNPRQWELRVVVVTSHDLTDRDTQRQLERLFEGYTSGIKHNELIDVEIVEVKK